MTHANHDPLTERGHSLEEKFFRAEDAKLLEKLRALKNTETTRDALAQATGITNNEVLDKLIALKIGGETAAALSVLPYVEVAWADGTMDAKERDSILTHARTKGFVPGSTEYALLETWLEKRPEPRFLAAWTELVRGLCEPLNTEQITTLRNTLIERARTVARASGGVFGIGKVSIAEKSMIEKLERVFDRRP